MARKHTPYYHKFMDLNAEMADRMGFDAAIRFTTTEEEHRATRETAGVYDVYYQGPIDIKGRDATRLLQWLLVNDLERVDDGGVLYSSVCNEQGGMLDDLTCYRFTGDHYWLIATPSRAGIIEQWVIEHAREMNAYVTNCVSGTAYLSIQGPRSREALVTLTDADLGSEALPYFSMTNATVAEVPCVVSRTGYSGELGYELYYPRDYSEHMWDAVLAAGADFGVVPAGLGALRTVRMEKKYPLFGLDLSENNTPVEANLGWTVRKSKRGYIGQDVLSRQKEDGPQRLLVGLAFNDLGFLPATGDSIAMDGVEVGKISSADRGWWLGRSLGMGYIAAAAAQAGSEVTVTSATSGESYPATVHTRAFHDPEMTRARA